MSDTNNELSGNKAEMVADNEHLYEDIMHQKARSLLAKYLPEALPQEPTELLVDIQPGYRGRFRGKHYIAIDDIRKTAELEDLIEATQQLGTNTREYQQRENEWMDIMISFLTAKNPVTPEDIAQLDGMKKQFFAPTEETSSTPTPTATKKDWEDPEKLLQGDNEYSRLSWTGVYTSVHELIHQRQAELNPDAFPNLSSEELDRVDLDNIPRHEFQHLINGAHKSDSKGRDINSIFYPVIEGSAVVGSYYVMGRLIDDLIASGDIETARRIQQARWDQTRRELRTTSGSRNYHGNYIEGQKMIRRLYKSIGPKNAPSFLTRVDLAACQSIAKGTTEYDNLAIHPERLPLRVA